MTSPEDSHSPAIPPPNFPPSTFERDSVVSPLRTAGGALINWWRAVTLDALIVGALWLVGLELLHVPLAPLLALLAAIFQFIPAFGPMLALIGPVLSVFFRESGDLWDIGLVLGLYGVIAIVEGLVVGPYILHRTTHVPWWAAFLGPIVLGILIPPWGVLIAPPLLAVVYAFRRSPAR